MLQLQNCSARTEITTAAGLQTLPILPFHQDLVMDQNFSPQPGIAVPHPSCPSAFSWCYSLRTMSRRVRGWARSPWFTPAPPSSSQTLPLRIVNQGARAIAAAATPPTTASLTNAVCKAPYRELYTRDLNENSLKFCEVDTLSPPFYR